MHVDMRSTHRHREARVFEHRGDLDHAKTLGFAEIATSRETTLLRSRRRVPRNDDQRGVATVHDPRHGARPSCHRVHHVKPVKKRSR